MKEISKTFYQKRKHKLTYILKSASCEATTKQKCKRIRKRQARDTRFQRRVRLEGEACPELTDAVCGYRALRKGSGCRNVQGLAGNRSELASTFSVMRDPECPKYRGAACDITDASHHSALSFKLLCCVRTFRETNLTPFSNSEDLGDIPLRSTGSEANA